MSRKMRAHIAVLVAATVLGNAFPVHAGFAMFGPYQPGGSGSDVMTPDDAELRAYVNNEGNYAEVLVVCYNDGWVAKAHGQSGSGSACGYPSRSSAEDAALESCPGYCQVYFSGYDSDEVRNMQVGNSALQNVIYNYNASD